MPNILCPWGHEMKTMMYYYTLVRMAKIKKLTTAIAGSLAEQSELSLITGGDGNGAPSFSQSYSPALTPRCSPHQSEK